MNRETWQSLPVEVRQQIENLTKELSKTVEHIQILKKYIHKTTGLSVYINKYGDLCIEMDKLSEVNPKQR